MRSENITHRKTSNKLPDSLSEGVRYAGIAITISIEVEETAFAT